MITGSIGIWFFVFGGLTTMLSLQFLFPNWYSRSFNKIEAGDDPALFYARQAGLAIAVQGVLMIWAGFDPALRLPTAVLAGTGKAVFVVTVLLYLRKFPGLLISAVVDSLAVVVLTLFLLGL